MAKSRARVWFIFLLDWNSNEKESGDEMNLRHFFSPGEPVSNRYTIFQNHFGAWNFPIRLSFFFKCLHPLLCNKNKKKKKKNRICDIGWCHMSLYDCFISLRKILHSWERRWTRNIFMILFAGLMRFRCCFFQVQSHPPLRFTTNPICFDVNNTASDLKFSAEHYAINNNIALSLAIYMRQLQFIDVRYFDLKGLYGSWRDVI